MHDIKVSMDTVKYSIKPEKREIAAISNGIGAGARHLDATSIRQRGHETRAVLK